MLSVAEQCGHVLSLVAVILFLAMALLAFVWEAHGLHVLFKWDGCGVESAELWPRRKT